MAGFSNSCYKCGADVTNEFYSSFQYSGKVCAACLRIEQQNKAMRDALEEDRRERAYQERARAREERPREEKPLPPFPADVENLSIFRKIIWASGENPHESIISMFFKDPQVKFFLWFFAVIFILAAIGKYGGS